MQAGMMAKTPAREKNIRQTTTLYMYSPMEGKVKLNGKMMRETHQMINMVQSGSCL